ncbi:MAG: oligosaccharide flippase family protein, partial [Williamsia herbipolensis]|nr:oligosaccharide flippase family protein [Williamsia herbipolensis]
MGRRARSSSARSPILTILVGTGLGQGLVIAVSPILTRMYGPADFGALAIVTAIASVLGAGATLGVDRAVIVSRGSRATTALVVLGLL